ncbi:MAG: DNA circularization N-terminal domain-containing protein [Methylovirgula sp.]
MPIDWRERMGPATFNGVAFYVDREELEESRRIITHEYPGSEDHDNEDLGRNASCFALTAYFCGETTDLDAAMLRMVLRQPGAGLLTLPMFGAILVRARHWRPTWSKEMLNFTGFSIEFVEESTQSPSVPLGLGAALLASAAAALPALLGAAVDQSLAGN